MIANFNQLPEYLYHATLFSDLASIQENGLGCVDNNNYDDPVYNQKGFFISFDCGDAFDYLNAANDARDIVVLEIPKKILDSKKVHYDTNNEDNIKNPTTWFYAGVIANPQAHIGIVCGEENFHD